MFRFGVGLATTVVTLSMIAAPIAGSARAQGHQEQKKPAAAAPARAAPAARPAPPPAVARQAPPPAAARPAQQLQRPAAAAQRAPRYDAPSRQAAPRVASPTGRSAPAIQRAVPAAKAATRTGVQQRTQQHQQNAQQPPAATPKNRAAERAQQNQQNAQQRLDRLQQQSKSGRLSRTDQRDLRQLQRKEQQEKTAQQRLEKLQTQSKTGRITRANQRELRRLERQQGAQQLQQRQQTGVQPEQRALRAQRVAPQQAAQGRFAAGLQSRQGNRADQRTTRLAARAAWRLGRLASYVPWQSAVYWPYAYADMFYYTFWPDAYDLGYWAYAYDAFFDGIYFPDGAPYVDYAYAGPYEGPDASATTGRASSRSSTTPGRVTQAARELCAQPAKGVTAWPFAEIEKAVQPSSEQQGLLDNLKKAAADAAAQLKDACPESLPMTPPGRLQTMTMRLQATRDAVKTVRPALETFYDSLSDEQKARFNEIGPKLKEEQRGAAGQPQSQPADCGGQKAGLSGLPIDRIDQVVQPTDAQEKALDRLSDAMQKAVGILSEACPTTTPLTPVGRMEVMEKRLDAMIEAANNVRPALEEFYAALSNEQKAKFNRLGRETAQSGG